MTMQHITDQMESWVKTRLIQANMLTAANISGTWFARIRKIEEQKPDLPEIMVDYNLCVGVIIDPQPRDKLARNVSMSLIHSVRAVTFAIF